MTGSTLADTTRFQSTLPRRERHQRGHGKVETMKFQSTLPRRERRPTTVPLPSSTVFQSTLPRRERPGFHQNHAVANLISIHAPAKGATQGHENTVYSYKYFNPRSREGSDLIRKFTRDIFSISIHAPAKGATLLQCPIEPLYCISIHAPAKGATHRYRIKL